MYKILSFDGGGIKGIVTLTLLQRLEQQVGARTSRPAETRPRDSAG